MKLWERLAVLIKVGELLAGDDVVKRDETDHNAVDSSRDGASEQLVIAAPSGHDGEITEHVDRTSVSRPRELTAT